MEQIHATCVDVEGVGILFLGAPGKGKSDLALRLIDGGARLVADDRTDLMLEEGCVIASAPPELAGRIEVRGIGILEMKALGKSPVGLAIDLVHPDDVERVPEPATIDLLGVLVALVRLAPFEASAPAKVRAALKAAARNQPGTKTEL